MSLSDIVKNRKLLLVLVLYALIIAVFCNSAFAAYIPAWGGYGRDDNVYSGALTDEKVIALTFDDGPHPRYTDEILDILCEYGIKATFFVIGRNAEAYPNQLRRIADEGHELGNHTYTHLELKCADKSKLMGELRKTESVVTNITGLRPKLFRPPRGYCSALTVGCNAEMGYKMVVWNVDTRDWAHSSEDNICRAVMNGVHSGSIVLFHDYVSGEYHTPAALKRIIPALLSEGYRFLTVSEMLELE